MFLKVIAMVLGLAFLIIIHEMGHLIAAKICRIKVTDFFVGFGPKLWSFTKGETTYGVAAIPLGGYVKMAGAEISEDEPAPNDKRSLLNASLTKKLFIILLGPLMNLVVAFLILAVGFSISGLVKPINVVGKTIKGTPAHKVLKQGDRIIEINGKKTAKWDLLAKEIRKHPKQIIMITIIRQGQEKQVRIKTIVRDNKAIIGIVPQGKRVRSLTIKESVKSTVNFISFIINTTNRLLFKAISGEPSELAKNSSSVVGAVYMGAKLSQSYIDYFFIIALISLALGYFNLLPIPPLDAGRAFLFIIERIKGSRISQRTMITVNGIGLAFLLTLMVYLVIKDIINIALNKFV